MIKYHPIIGLEIHAELKTKSKMFCGCVNDPFHAPAPNTYTCPVCLGMPGALPIANRQAIEWTIMFGLALDCQINLFSKFDRKNYFYPDLAKGYQISQYDLPFCYQGKLMTSFGPVGITRIHLEEDTGKLLHETVKGEPVTLVDFNRSGVPLVEIVSEPDIKSGEQAKEYGKKIRQILRYLDIADCQMAEGGMRLEANVSLQKPGETGLPNYKVEVKNINSFRFLEQAIAYEINRQSQILDQGQTPAQETRGWNHLKNETFTQRTKEDAADYRYFPDPDLPPIELSTFLVDQLRTKLPELPAAKIARWHQEFQIEPNLATSLTIEPQLANWLEKIWPAAQAQQISPNQLAKDLINKKISYQVMDPASLLFKQFQELHQTAAIDQSKLQAIVTEVLTANQDAAAKFKAGKTQIIGFLIGQVMAKLSAKIDPKLVKDELLKVLNQ